MLEDFFQLTPEPANQMLGTYDLRLVLLSYMVAFLASYVALDVAGRLRDVSNTPLTRRLWIAGGALAMGAGIWSMHFIGMLAFTMHGMIMTYDLSWTGLSLLVAIFASAFALYLLTPRDMHVSHMAFGGVILGLAIASMHYLGMQGMSSSMDIHYLPGLFTLSIVIAIAASEAALWFAIKSNQVVAQLRFRFKVISAMIMGAAIAGMHYTGMFAAVFTPVDHSVAPQLSVSPELMATGIAVITCVIMGIAFFLSAKKEALNEQLLRNARQAGMAEVAISVLHNVGNVLNSVNVSANLVAERIENSKLALLSDLSQMINQHKSDLGEFFTKDPKGMQIPDFIAKLASHWQEERMLMNGEIQALLKHLQHIKDIIAMQQNLSKKVQIEQITSIETAIDEAILICGIDENKHGIVIEKHYEKMKPVLIDKVKLLQILVNLLHNAKEALMMGKNHTVNKIMIRTGLLNKKQFYIEVSDNGPGISADNLSKIFTHGFTTKESGHGFGLHASALAAKDMGGSMKVASPGINQGAIFTLELAYRVPKQ
jgi:NO-binding membrane sensor protein with MHYT domain